MAPSQCQNKQNSVCLCVWEMHVCLCAHMWVCVLLLSATVCQPKQTGLMRSSSWDTERESEREWNREREGGGWRRAGDLARPNTLTPLSLSPSDLKGTLFPSVLLLQHDRSPSPPSPLSLLNTPSCLGFSPPLHSQLKCKGDRRRVGGLFEVSDCN